jgi:hypothetical protein
MIMGAAPNARTASGLPRVVPITSCPRWISMGISGRPMAPLAPAMKTRITALLPQTRTGMQRAAVFRRLLCVTTGSVLVRRDIWSLEQEQPWHPVTLAYALAIGEMKRRSSVDPADPTGWTYQTQVHGQRPPPGDVWRDQCQHSTWFFLPWHRMYLFWFEQTVRSIVQGLAPIDAATKETWALPYWNYTDPRPSTAPPPLLDTLPAAYRSRLLPSGETNQLFVAQRDPAVNADPSHASGRRPPRLPCHLGHPGDGRDPVLQPAAGRGAGRTFRRPAGSGCTIPSAGHPGRWRPHRTGPSTMPWADRAG